MSLYRVVLDYGHGGIKSGAVYNGVQEKDVNLQLGSQIYEAIHRLSTASETIKVLLTRDTDQHIPLSVRTGLINEYNLSKPINQVVSIHFHAALSVPSVSGFEAYYLAGSTKGTDAAKSIVESVANNGFKVRGQGYKTTASLGRQLAMIHKTHPPAVLIEAGFLSNAQDRANATDARWQESMANAVASGIWGFLRQ